MRSRSTLFASLSATVLLLTGCGQKSAAKVEVDAGKTTPLATAEASATVDAGAKPTTACTPAKGGKYALRFPSDDHVVTSIASDACGNVLFAGSFKKTLELGGAPLEPQDKEDIFLAKFASNGSHLFSKVIGGTGKQTVRGLGTDGEGHFYLAGMLDGKVTLGSTVREPASKGGSNFFVAHLNAEGEHKYSRVVYDEAPGAQPTAIAVDGEGNTIIAGKFSRSLHLADPPWTSPTGGIFIAKYNAYATHRGSFIVAADKYPNSISVSSLALEKDGSILVAGTFENEVDFGKGKTKSAGKTDMFLAKYTLSGTPAKIELAWVKHYGDNEINSGKSVVVDSEGNSYFAGVDDRKSPGEPAWKRQRVVELYKHDPSGKKLWGPKYLGMGSKEGIDDPVLAANGTSFALVGTITESMNVGAESLEVAKGTKVLFVTTFNDAGKALSSEASELEMPTPRQALYDANQELIVTGNTATKPFPGTGPYGIFLQKFATKTP